MKRKKLFIGMVTMITISCLLSCKGDGNRIVIQAEGLDPEPLPQETLIISKDEYRNILIKDTIEVKDKSVERRIKLLDLLIDSMTIRGDRIKDNEINYRDSLVMAFYDKIEVEEVRPIDEILALMKKIDKLDSKIIQLEKSIPEIELEKSDHIYDKYKKYYHMIEEERKNREAAFQSWKRGTDHLRDSLTTN